MNETRLKVKKRVSPKIAVTAKYLIDFSVPITKGSISTNGFRLSGSGTVFYIDDSEGVLNLFYVVNGIRIQHSVIGTANYSEGVLSIPSITIDSVDNSAFISVTATPRALDISPKRNLILTYLSEDIKVRSSV